MAKELNLIAVGDIVIGTPENYPHISHASPITKERSDRYSWLEHIAPALQQGALTMGNLENPICVGGRADAVKLATGGGIIRMPPEAAHAMRRAGITAVSLANNHCMDLGPEKMLETIEHLDQAGIAWSGGGRNIAEARRPAIMERDGVRLAFLS